MTAQKSWRKRIASVLATATAALVVASGLALAPTAANAVEGDVAGATLEWGVKSSFRNYIKGPIAGGSVTATGVTENNGGTTFTWNEGEGTASANGDFADVAFSGDNGVHFSGHHGILDFTLTNPQIVVTSATTAELYMDAAGKEFIDTNTTGPDYVKPGEKIADVVLEAPSVADGVVTWTNAEATLAAGAEPIFAGFYAAGAEVDPVTFSLPVEQAAVPVATAKVSSVTPQKSLTVAVEASGLPTDISAAYVALIEKGTADAVTAQSGYAAFLYPFPSVVDGKTSFGITAAIDKLDRTKQYEVLIWKQHSDVEGNIYALADVNISAANWGQLYRSGDQPSLQIEPAAGLNPAGETVTVTGTGYNPEQAIYLTYCAETPLEALTFQFIAAGCTSGSVVVTPNPTTATMVKFNADGSFEAQLTVKPRVAGQDTVVYTIANHTAMTDRTQDAKAEVSFAEVEQTSTTTKLTVSPARTAVQGSKVTMKAAVTPSDAAGTVTFFDGTKKLGATQNLASGSASISVADLAVGSHDLKAEFTPADETFSASAGSVAGFKVTKKETVVPTPTVTFTDIKKGDKFFKEISWMAAEGISTGVKQANGTYKFEPKNNVTREAMAAFLFRNDKDSVSFKAPKTSPFTDVKPGDKFYKEITWMAAEGISKGVKQADGTVKFMPKSSITREAMAAFMYRIDDNAKPALPKTSPFVDVKKGDNFYKEIVWMSQKGISTGINQGNNKKAYAPKSSVTREAMSAFLYRAK